MRIALRRASCDDHGMPIAHRTPRLALTVAFPVAFLSAALAGPVGCSGESAQSPAETGASSVSSATPATVAVSPATAVADESLAAGFKNLFTDGAHYFAGFPTTDGLAAIREKGVRRVVSLKSPEEIAEKCGFEAAPAFADAGLEVAFLPLGAEEIDDASIARFAEVLAEAEAAAGGEPVLIHCGSSNTVGMMWAGYLAKVRGVDAATAFDLGVAAGLKRPESIAATRRALGLPALPEPPAEPAAPAGGYAGAATDATPQ